MVKEMKYDKRITSDLQNSIQRTKDRATRSQLKSGGDQMCPRRESISCLSWCRYVQHSLYTWHPSQSCCKDTIFVNFITLLCIGVCNAREYHFSYNFIVLCDRNDVLSTDQDICIPSFICFARMNLLEQYHIVGDAWDTSRVEK